MRILLVGDVVGKPGRRGVRQLLPGIVEEYGVDLVLVNGENAAGGFGLTPDTAQELFEAGADVITSGNHIWDKQEVLPLLDGEAPILRPLNYPPGVPGRGYLRIKGAYDRDRKVFEATYVDTKCPSKYEGEGSGSGKAYSPGP